MSDIKTKRYCLVCRKSIPSAITLQQDMDVSDSTMDAVIFAGRGNYGSTVFDPLDHDRHHIEITVCDMCLSHLRNYVILVATEDPKETPHPWTPIDTTGLHYE